MLAGKLADAAPYRARAGEGDHRDVGINADRLTRFGATGQDLKHALGQARFLEQPRDDEAAGERGARIRLEHDSIAGGEGGRNRSARQNEWEMEWRDDADHAAWHAPGQ